MFFGQLSTFWPNWTTLVVEETLGDLGTIAQALKTLHLMFRENRVWLVARVRAAGSPCRAESEDFWASLRFLTKLNGFCGHGDIL